MAGHGIDKDASAPLHAQEERRRGWRRWSEQARAHQVRTLPTSIHLLPPAGHSAAKKRVLAVVGTLLGWRRPGEGPFLPPGPIYASQDRSPPPLACTLAKREFSCVDAPRHIPRSHSAIWTRVGAPPKQWRLVFPRRPQATFLSTSASFVLFVHLLASGITRPAPRTTSPHHDQSLPRFTWTHRHPPVPHPLSPPHSLPSQHPQKTRCPST